ncbi:hypothetical protein PRZ48_007562 [Zasmidium cellare]|uniref:Telomeric single stranded DNA binding POT1/Cdc13 domain-containing protein n=1 Tax=Zasmidium cellare TaxID=395010 RepID=A0ABR0EKK8_ZASCE|nr:hypothetical protein PRZ48_007562 [Zasmidium cellare]
MEATTIPINALSPSEAPPASKSIRAIVSLLWPYSSSTKQCALLLADPDFRLRNRKGQVRVRFTGPSAEAIAKGRIGIGDELVLELRGAQWTGEQTRVATPGKSVEGELVYGGQLALKVSKKANGEESGVRIQVNESTPPPEQPEKPISNGNHATPARAAPLWMRMSMGADVTPIYSSPAFVKRSRLSADKTSWDPFADVEKELEDDAGPRKRQRISFGGVKRWRHTERTPSPEKEEPSVMEIDADEEQSIGGQEVQTAVEHSEDATKQDVPAAKSSPAEIDQSPSRSSGLPTMPPPPLPRLQLPSNTSFSQTQQDQQNQNADDDGPSTPKLHPVPSSALPLPSPFPTEASQVHFGNQAFASTVSNSALDALVEAADVAREREAQNQTDSQPEQSVAQEMLDVITDVPEFEQAGSQPDQPLVLSSSPAASLASTAEIVRDEESFDQRPNVDVADAQQSMSRDVQPHDQAQHTVPEYLSDTEEDEDMYYDHMRRRFPSVTESGRVRIDHQEEGYYDELSQLHEDDAEEVIDADDMGEEPPSEESDEEESDEDVDDQEDSEEEVVEISETPHDPVANLEVAVEEQAEGPLPINTKKQSIPDPEPSPPINAIEALTEAREELRKENRETLKTPARPPAGLFGFDGAANDTPFQPKSTPQSEKERVMAKTFSSLFGFKASPSPELPKQQQMQTPTPAVPAGQSFQSAEKKIEAASVPVAGTDTEAEVEEEEEHDMPDVANDHTTQTLPATDHIDPPHASVKEAAEAVEETGDSLQATDVNDGSLLSVVHADEHARDHAKHGGIDQTSFDADLVEQSLEKDEMPVVNETPQVDVEMEDVHEDPLPDGVPINQELGEAIAPERHEEPPASSAPRPTQVTVVDLGDSSDEDEEPAQAVADQAEQQESRLERDEPSYPDLTQQRMPAPSLYTRDPPSQSGHRQITQDSQGSALQSDMLDTTQTTVDRSEIATPIAEEHDTVIADTSQENAPWLERDQQDGFFAEQIQNQEFEGAAMPQLTQQTTATVNDPYHYFSFQSATSVATDNSDNIPPTAVQSFVKEEQQIESAPDDQTPPREFEFAPHDAALLIDPALAIPDTLDRTQSAVGQSMEEPAHDDMIMDVEPAPVPGPKLSQSVEEVSSPMEVDSAQVSSFAQQAQAPEPVQLNSSFERRLSEEIALERQPASTTIQVTETIVESRADESEDAAEQTLSRSEQASHQALPISPEDSQHRLESQGFETQIPYIRVSNELPPTPQLTQGDSRTNNELQVEAEEADEVAPHEPSTPPRTRRAQKAASEALESPAKKTPVRRSPRKTQEDAGDVAKPSQESSHDSEQPQVTASQRRRRSVQIDPNHTLLSPTQKTPVRRSPRKSHAPTETLDKVAEREEEEDIASQASFQQSSFTSTEKGSVRRSPRKSQAETQTSDRASQDMEVVTPAKRSGRQPTSKEKTQSTNSDMKTDEAMEESEDMEDTISVTPPVKASSRQSAKKAQTQVESREDKESTAAQRAVPPKTPTTSRKSFTTRLGHVPAAIADWFSPRRSTRQETEAEDTTVDEPTTLKRQKSSGFSTSLSYFIPLSNLDEKLGPASQYQTDNTVDILAVVTDETKVPERAKSGPKDYFTIFRITDSSLPDGETTRVEVFRHWHSVLPKAQVGDVILLRAFAVKTRKRQPYLISTDSSAWCVWRYAEIEGEGDSAEKHVPVTRKRGASFSATSGAREEVRGPPVELGEEERGRVAELRKWWKGLHKKNGDQEDVELASPRSTRTTRSQKL